MISENIIICFSDKVQLKAPSQFDGKQFAEIWVCCVIAGKLLKFISLVFMSKIYRYKIFK